MLDYIEGSHQWRGEEEQEAQDHGDDMHGIELY